MITLIVLGSCLGAAQGELVTGPVETVAEGFLFTEGPIWLPTDALAFSDIPADTVYRADKSVVRKPSGKSNGLTLDGEGRLVSCEHGNRRVTRIEKDGTVTVLADAYEGKKLNSPNDVVVRSDGVVFFTDPPYGLEGRDAELDVNGVYAILTDGRVKLLAKDFVRPNGLAFSPDEKTLYVADTQENHLRAFDVAADGGLSKGRVFCQVSSPDGIKVDTRGYVWSTSAQGVAVFDTEGKHLDTIKFPQWPANCAFGDKDSKTLYVTARTGVYKVRCATPGIRPKGGTK